jgi:glucose-6-phosphate 1-epimerase
VKLDFGLYSSALADNFKKAWPRDFGLIYSVTLSPEGLRTIVQVRNEGTESFEFQLLLHTYLRVKVRRFLLDHEWDQKD